MTHANDAFAYALFLFIWFRTRRDRSAWQYALLGASAALCALVRNQNAVFVLFPLVAIGLDSFRQAGQRGWISAGLWGTLRAALFSLTWWVIFSPQLGVWRVVFGRWVPGNPYETSGGGSFDFLNPRLLDVLLSTNRGLWLWTPVALLGVLGWLILWRNQRRFAALLMTNFLLQLYIIASWSAWDGSAAFGQRFFTNMMPAFAIGLAALCALLARRVAMRWLVFAGSLFVAWNGLLIVRYVLEDVPRSGPVPLDHFIIGQFTVIPRHFAQILEILLTRGSGS
ncbi:MAG: hypothetical protein HC802_12835 [Caldilineaceae bacterium]|nr:hypothetical protein [Caldilineaceae bacterium]